MFFSFNLRNYICACKMAFVGEAGGQEIDEEQSGSAESKEEDMEAEGQYNFTVELLKSHVDQNNHGVVS